MSGTTARRIALGFDVTICTAVDSGRGDGAERLWRERCARSQP